MAALAFVLWPEAESGRDAGSPAAASGPEVPPPVADSTAEASPRVVTPSRVPPATLEEIAPPDEIEPEPVPVAVDEAPGEGSPQPAEPVRGSDPVVLDSPRLTRLVDIRWARLADGQRFTIVGDGPIPAGRVSHFRLDGESPREVVRVGGISERFAGGTLEVGGPAVQQIRTGLHRRAGGDEIHVVLDLADPSFRITDVRTAGSRIEIDIGSP